jgi:DNA primase catalytic subunit
VALSLSTTLKYYKRDDVQDAIVRAAQSREVAVKYGEKGFGRRPDTLQYPRDVLEFAKQGASSFHVSEERWSNPLAVDTGLKRQELDGLRQGWDLILDIDCKWLEYSTVAAQVLIDELHTNGIRTLSVKFSGNHGFHIGVPFEAFPEHVTVKGQVFRTKDKFPEGPRIIAKYLQQRTLEKMGRAILALEGSVDAVVTKTGKAFKELAALRDGVSVFNPFSILAIDTVLIASRHLYRMPYCFNEKSGLVSIPLKIDELPLFDRSWAAPERVAPELGWLDRSPEPNEAATLFREAFDSVFAEELKTGTTQVARGSTEPRGELSLPAEAIPEEHFPPCMKAILRGIPDGKKRAMFGLYNFLRSVGWSTQAIEQRLLAWNAANPEPLRENLIGGHMRAHEHQKPMLPPNCPRAGQSFFADINVCQPDHLCSRIKNPANYSIVRLRMAVRAKEDETPKRRRRAEVEA